VSRRSARETVFKTLFQADITGENPEMVLAQDLMQESIPQESDKDFARSMVVGITEKIQQLDETLAPHLKKWALKRLSFTDRAILRLAIYEIRFDSGVPPAVSINEALELAKKYSDEKSAAFINGVLDNIFRNTSEETME
jgi:transcription antitermination protein NusB